MSGKNCMCQPVVVAGGTGPPGPPGPPGLPGECDCSPGEGLCVAAGGGLSVDPDGCLQVNTGDGLEIVDDTVTVCLSDAADNTAQIVDGCLYVPPGEPTSPGEPPELCIQDDSATVLDVDEDGCLGLVTDPGGPVRPGPDGLTVCLSQQPDNIAQLDDDGCLYVPEVELPGSPPEAVCISGDADNQLTEGSDGCLYVPPSTQPNFTIEQEAEMVVFEEDGTFNIADYPDAQYIRVRAVGAGGGSAGAIDIEPDAAVTVSGAGGAGSYAESMFNVSDLPAGAIGVWVGQGGAGGSSAPSGGTPTNGEDGTGSAFGGSGTVPPNLDGLVFALGGRGGGASTTDWREPTDFTAIHGPASIDQEGAFSSVGQIVVQGGGGEMSWAIGPAILGAGNSLQIGGSGGTNPLSSRNSGSLMSFHTGRVGSSYGGSALSEAGIPYGGGGIGVVATFEGIRAPDGYPGANGVVIVEVYSARIVAV